MHENGIQYIKPLRMADREPRDMSPDVEHEDREWEVGSAAEESDLDLHWEPDLEEVDAEMNLNVPIPFVPAPIPDDIDAYSPPGRFLDRDFYMGQGFARPIGMAPSPPAPFLFPPFEVPEGPAGIERLVCEYSNSDRCIFSHEILYEPLTPVPEDELQQPKPENNIDYTKVKMYSFLDFPEDYPEVA